VAVVARTDDAFFNARAARGGGPNAADGGKKVSVVSFLMHFMNLLSLESSFRGRILAGDRHVGIQSSESPNMEKSRGAADTSAEREIERA